MKKILKKHSMDRLTTKIVNGALAYQIETGGIDPRGKSDQELLKELRSIFRRAKGPVNLTVDHTSALLKRARDAAKAKEHEQACLFFATWIEHMLNRMLYALAIRTQFDEKDGEN